MADIDSALEQETFDLPQRERIADVEHHRDADHLGRAVEAAEGTAHRWRRHLNDIDRPIRALASR
jgi:hypothetical protein